MTDAVWEDAQKGGRHPGGDGAGPRHRDDESDVPVSHREVRVPVGDARDFTAFYRETYQDVARALAYTLGDTDLGAEAADEAMARAYPRWSVIREYDSPAGWVYRVGLNWARSVHRRLARRLPVLAATAATLPPVPDPAVKQALQELDTKLRAVVVCRLLLDWSVDDTARALGVRPGTVKSRLHRSLRLLSDRLDHLR